MEVTRETIIGIFWILTKKQVSFSWKSACTVWTARYPEANALKTPAKFTAPTQMR